MSENGNTYRRLLRYARPYAGYLVLSFFGAFVVAGTDATIAKLVQPFIDQVLVEKDEHLARLVPFIVLFLGIMKGVARYMQEAFIQISGLKAIRDLRNDYYNHLMGLSLRYYSTTSTGSLMSRGLTDIGMLNSALTNVLLSLVRESLTVVALIMVAFYTNWRMAAMAFAVLPVVGITANLLGKKIKKFGKRGQEAAADLTKSIEQGLSGIKVIKSFASEKREISRFEQQNSVYFRMMRRVITYTTLQAPINETVTAIGLAMILWYAMPLVIAGELTSGELFSVMAAIMMMYNPAKRLSRVFGSIQQSLASAERVFEVMDVQAEVVDPVEAVSIQGVKGQIEFSKVDFSYGERPVLKKFSLNIPAGEVVALVGSSGAGKSTVASLLMRGYDPQSGSVKVDNIDIRRFRRSDLLSKMAFVDQEMFLFDDSVLENIRYGATTADINQVRRAAEQAYISDVIDDLPDGYQTQIGNRGVRLSGGQRQRLCIARAILRDAPVLVLDEATSALDTESEAIVQKAMSNLMQGRTTIVIAHRLSTIMNADRIVVMDSGEIREVGTHGELLAKDGLYKKLYDMQFKDGNA